MTIHTGHPFDTGDRDPARQLRGRLGGSVTLWTAGAGRRRAGLTVSSMLVVLGQPARVLAVLDPDADLTERLTETGGGVLHLLGWEQRTLAEMFAGVTPAPGGGFAHADFEETDWGPRLLSAATWAGLRVESTREVGWSEEVTCVLEHVEVGADLEPLVSRRGRWIAP